MVIELQISRMPSQTNQGSKLESQRLDYTYLFEQHNPVTTFLVSNINFFSTSK